MHSAYILKIKKKLGRILKVFMQTNTTRIRMNPKKNYGPSFGRRNSDKQPFLLCIFFNFKMRAGRRVNFSRQRANRRG